MKGESIWLWSNLILWEREILSRNNYAIISGIALALVGVKIRLAAGDNIAMLIDANLLVIGCLLLLASILSQQFIRIYIWFYCPDEVFLSPTTEEYLDRAAKRTIDSGAFIAAYDYHLTTWSNMDRNESPRAKVFGIILVALNSTLLLLTTFAFVASAHQIIVQMWTHLWSR